MTIKESIKDKFVEKLEQMFFAKPTNEWMGLVFYNIKGDVLDGIEIEILDFIALAEGHRTFVDVDFEDPIVSEKYQDYIFNKYPDAKFGLIHRHPGQVFISEEDRREIEQKLFKEEYIEGYLSVVVNHLGDILLSFNIVVEYKEEITKTIYIKGKEKVFTEPETGREIMSLEKVVNVKKKFSKVDDELMQELSTIYKSKPKWKAIQDIKD